MKAVYWTAYFFVYCSCPLGLKVIRDWIFFLCKCLSLCWLGLRSQYRKNLWWSGDNRHWVVFNSNIMLHQVQTLSPKFSKVYETWLQCVYSIFISFQNKPNLGHCPLHACLFPQLFFFLMLFLSIFWSPLHPLGLN